MLSSDAHLSAESEVSIGLEGAQKESLESIGLSLVHLGQVVELEHADLFVTHAAFVEAGAVLARRAVFFLRRGALL